MNKLKIFSAVALAAMLGACGGANEADRQTPDLVIPTVPPTPTPEPRPVGEYTHIPFLETFTVSDTVSFFSADYKELGGEYDPEEDQFYFSTGGVFDGDVLDPSGGNWITADNDQAMRLGNARFSIAQPPKVSGDARTKTTQAGDTFTWGELDLSVPWRLSFCVIESSGTESGSSKFELYMDNNSTGSANSIHGGLSRLVSTPTSGFVAGKRVVIDVPGDVVLTEDGNAVASVSSAAAELGTLSSFLQVRVSSGGYIVFDDMALEFQDETALSSGLTDCSTKTTAYANVNPWVNATPTPEPTATPEPTPTPDPTPTPVDVGDVAWTSYNADSKPTDAASIDVDGVSGTFEEGNGDFPIADYWTATSGVGSFVSPEHVDGTETDIKTYADYGPIVGDTFPKTYTMVTRLANPNGVSKAFEIEMAFGGDIGGNAGRIKFMLRDSKIDFEKLDDATTESWSFPDTGFDATGFHDYQVSVTLTGPRTADLSLYVDGANDPVFTTSTTTLRTTNSERNEIRIGENGSAAYDAQMDWIIWTSDGAYTPAQLVGKLPAGLGDTSNYDAASSPAEGATWAVFNADAKPTDASSLTDGATVTTWEEGNGDFPIADYWTAASGVGSFVSPEHVDGTETDIKTYADYGPIVGDTFPKTYTMVTRLANPNGVSKAFEIEMAFGGDIGGNAGRIKFMLRDSKIDFEKFDDATTESWSFPDTGFDATGFHDYQVSVTLTGPRTADLSLYVDGASDAVYTTSTTTLRTTNSERNEIRIGENGSAAYDAQMDWIIWSADGAFTADDLIGQLPSGLGDTSNYD